MGINVKELKAMQKAAAQAHQDAIAAAKYALENHAAYGPALKTNKVAQDLASAVFEKANDYISTLASDPQTDPSWFPYLSTFANTAHQMVYELVTSRNFLIADMAAHFTLSKPEIEINPALAAAAIDKAAKTPSPVLSPAHPSATPNPNADKPADQSPQHPPEDPPPVPDDTPSPWTIAAALALGALALRWIFG
jgi:hypothetical protein